MKPVTPRAAIIAIVTAALRAQSPVVVSEADHGVYE